MSVNCGRNGVLYKITCNAIWYDEGKTVSSNRTMVPLGDGAENNTNKNLFLPLMVNICKCDCKG